MLCYRTSHAFLVYAPRFIHPQCAHVKLAEGREINVLIKQLALAGISSNKKKNIFNHIGNAQGVENVPQVTEDAVTTQNVKNCL